MDQGTSRFFCAQLGPANHDFENFIRRWATNTCVSHRISIDKSGNLTLLAERDQERSVASFKKLLKTATARCSAIPTSQDRPDEWLILLSSDDYHNKTITDEDATCKAEQIAITEDALNELGLESEERGDTEESAVDETAAEEAAVPSRTVVDRNGTVAARGGVVVRSLSDGFDEKAKAIASQIASRNDDPKQRATTAPSAIVELSKSSGT